MDGIENHPYWPDQVQIEKDIVDIGHQVYTTRQEYMVSRGQGADLGPGKALVNMSLQQLTKAIEEYVSGVLKSGAGRRASAVPIIQELGADVCAVLTLKTVVSGLMRADGVSVVAIAQRVGRWFQREYGLQAFIKKYPKTYRAAITEGQITDGQRMDDRFLAMREITRGTDFVLPTWDHPTVINLGMLMLDIMSSSTGIISVSEVKQRGKKKVGRMVSLTPGAQAELTRVGSDLINRTCTFMPCVVPPTKWQADNPVGGGYYACVSLTPMTLITGTHPLKGPVSSTVVDAVNQLQEVPWRINPLVHAVMTEVYDRQMDHLNVLPLMTDMEFPPKPEDIGTNEAVRREWSRKARQVREENNDRRAKRRQSARVLSLASRYGQYPNIYFPHRVDFRGRLYPVPAFLHPQGPDYVKGLLMFSEGHALGDEQGPGWLAIHGANCFGVDKVSFEDRIQWVEDHMNQIVHCAEDPMGQLWWTEADHPWQFLAFCFEWKGYQEQGAEFVSHLPVMMDGSCNGIQHFSAMLRDEEGGRSVNLVPLDKPADIYARVADVVMDTLRKSDNPYAAGWVSFGIDRRITKRPVMVLPYGGTSNSCRNYVHQAVKEKGPTPWDDNNVEEIKAMNFLSVTVWQAIGQVVVGARSAMDWLQQCTQAAIASGRRDLVWTTPSGFVVRQRYNKTSTTRHKVVLSGVSYRYTMAVDTRKPDRQAHVQAISPNFVHSMDASCLVDTILLFAGNGGASFAAVHDSFGCHAAQAHLLYACTRQAFVDMYHDVYVLASFRDGLQSQGVEGLPDLLPLGSLDISGVLQSDFFFA